VIRKSLSDLQITDSDSLMIEFEPKMRASKVMITGCNYSDFVEAQISKSIQETVVPVQYQMDLWYALATFDDQLDDIEEVSFTSRNFIWVDISLLELGKEELTRSYVVGVRPHHHYGHPQPLQHAHGGCGLMIRCTIPLDYGALSPVSVNLVQLGYQMFHEEPHH